MAIINFLKNYERMARFKWGNFQGMRGPGPVWLIPIMHSGARVDLRTEVIDIPRQRNITKDNAPIDIDFLVYMRVVAEYADRAVLEVENYRGAVIGLATTTLRAVVGDIDLDEVLSQRERINTVLRERLDAETERWGIKVTNVEIREIEPPRDIQDAMNRQMSAERIRRAVVREAEGTREAAVTVAEGEKQAAILKAEGQRQAEILTAEGRPAGGDSQGGRLRQRSRPHIRHRPERRPEYHEPAVLRDPEGDRERRFDQVHLPDGIHQPAQAVCRFRPRRKGQRRSRRLEAQPSQCHSSENNPRPISRRGDSRIAPTAIFMIGGVGDNRHGRLL